MIVCTGSLIASFSRVSATLDGRSGLRALFVLLLDFVFDGVLGPLTSMLAFTYLMDDFCFPCWGDIHFFCCSLDPMDIDIYSFRDILFIVSISLFLL